MRFGPPTPLESHLCLMGAGPSSGAAFVGPLDAYTANLSVMLLPFRGLSGYAGNGFRLRDTNDDSEQNVGFHPVTGDLASFSVVGNAAVRWWYDQSGAARDLPQATAASQPYLTLNVVNGQPVVRFDGSNDFMTGSDSAAAGKTVYQVLRMRSAADYGAVRMAFAGHSNSVGVAASLFTSANWYYYATPAFGSPIIGGAVNTLSLMVLAYTSGSTCSSWVNNTAGAVFTPQADYTASANYTLGSGVNGASNWANVDVVARLVYATTHDTTTRQAIQTILATKFGITLA